MGAKPLSAPLATPLVTYVELEDLVQLQPVLLNGELAQCQICALLFNH